MAKKVVTKLPISPVQIEKKVVDTPMPRMFQSVIVSFSDGTKGYFLGPAVVDRKNASGKLVVDIEFTDPKELPPDMHFEVLEEGKVH